MLWFVTRASELEVVLELTLTASAAATSATGAEIQPLDNHYERVGAPPLFVCCVV